MAFKAVNYVSDRSGIMTGLSTMGSAVSSAAIKIGEFQQAKKQAAESFEAMQQVSLGLREKAFEMYTQAGVDGVTAAQLAARMIPEPVKGEGEKYFDRAQKGMAEIVADAKARKAQAGTEDVSALVQKATTMPTRVDRRVGERVEIPSEEPGAAPSVRYLNPIYGGGDDEKKFFDQPITEISEGAPRSTKQEVASYVAGQRPQTTTKELLQSPVYTTLRERPETEDEKAKKELETEYKQTSIDKMKADAGAANRRNQGKNAADQMKTQLGELVKRQQAAQRQVAANLKEINRLLTERSAPGQNWPRTYPASLVKSKEDELFTYRKAHKDAVDAFNSISDQITQKQNEYNSLYGAASSNPAENLINANPDLVMEFRKAYPDASDDVIAAMIEEALNQTE